MPDPDQDLAFMQLLPDETAATLSRLEWLSRGKMEGAIAGRHASPFKGFSAEFAEHRQYAQGDDLRNLDWRAYGKSDRYYIKQYVDETNLRATIVLDCSGSMAYRGDEAAAAGGEPCSKFRYGQFLAAALAYLFIRQRDAAGLVTFDTQVREYLPAASRPAQVRHILEKLHRSEPGGETAAADVLHEVAERIPRRGLVLLISDLFDTPEKIAPALHHFRHRRHEVAVFHVMAEEELTFPFKKFNNFRSLEVPDTLLKIDPKSVRKAYLDHVGKFLKEVEKACGQIGADYVPARTKRRYDETLAEYLTKRRLG
ncbi:MAG: DUF58 domain-containing protein [Verrucomicrobiales bacterium]